MITDTCGDKNDNMCREMVSHNTNFITCDSGIVYLWFEALTTNTIDIKSRLHL